MTLEALALSTHSRCRYLLSIGLLLLGLCSLLPLTVASPLQGPDRALSLAMPVPADPVAASDHNASGEDHEHVLCGAAGCSDHCHSATDLGLPVVVAVPRYRAPRCASSYPAMLVRGFRQAVLRPPIGGLVAGPMERTAFIRQEPARL